MISTPRKRQFMEIENSSENRTKTTSNDDKSSSEDGYHSNQSKNSSRHSLQSSDSADSCEGSKNKTNQTGSDKTPTVKLIGNATPLDKLSNVEFSENVLKNVTKRDTSSLPQYTHNHNQQRMPVGVSQDKSSKDDSDQKRSMQALQPTKVPSKKEAQFAQQHQIQHPSRLHNQHQNKHQIQHQQHIPHHIHQNHQPIPFCENHQSPAKWPEAPIQIETRLAMPNPLKPRPLDPKQPFYDTQVAHFNEKYAIEAKTTKSTSGFIWMGSRRSDGLPVVAKQIPKHKVHRFGRIDGFPHKVPYEFVALHRVQKYAKSAEHNKSVVKLLDFYERRSSYVMVMEQLQNGMDLLDYLNMRQIPLDESVSRKIFKQAVAAAIACKRAGVYHRDWKDENIVINRETHEIKLIDFGCAIPRNQGPFAEVSGTPQFSPPEWWDVYHQNRDKRDAQRNGLVKRPKLMDMLNMTWDGDTAEMWGLGVMLYTMLHIKLPFQNESEIRQTDICSVINPRISNECFHLISALLSKTSSKRMTLQQVVNHPWMNHKS